MNETATATQETASATSGMVDCSVSYISVTKICIAPAVPGALAFFVADAYDRPAARKAHRR